MKSKKILFANFPADGHFNPLTGLAVHLKGLGHDVRWYTGRKYEEKRKLAEEFEQHNPAWRFEHYVNELLSKHERSPRATFLKMIQKYAEEKVY